MAWYKANQGFIDSSSQMLTRKQIEEYVWPREAERTPAFTNFSIAMFSFFSELTKSRKAVEQLLIDTNDKDLSVTLSKEEVANDDLCHGLFVEFLKHEKLVPIAYK